MYKNVIAIFFLLCEIVSADCLLYESEAFAIEAADEYRRSCESYGGGGGVFSSSVSENTPNNTCGGYYVENAYVLRVSCNTCGSVTMQEELNANKEYCNALCKVAALSCMTPLNSWGSVLSGEATACGNDDASLPGCSESSSSESEESSSSEASSSSQAQSSSGAESSSSEEDESSSSEELESSSSEDDDSSSSFEESSSSGESSSSENTSSSSWHIFPCYKPDGMGGCKIDKYVSFEPMPMVEEPQLDSAFERMTCLYWKNGTARIEVNTNVPMQQYSQDYIYDYKYCYYDENDCGNVPHDSVGEIPYLKHPFYSCYGSYGLKGSKNGCLSSEDGVWRMQLTITEQLKLINNYGDKYSFPSNLTEEKALELADAAVAYIQSLKIFYEGEYVKTESYRQRVDNEKTIRAAMDDCIYYAQLYEKSHTSSSSYSSSSNSFSSSSEEKSSSSESSSSSEPPSSSSLSSSSEELSSSSEEIVVESSSVMSVDEPFVAGPDQVYTPDQIFSSGLQNMEPGACYSLNPDRGTIYGWNISYNASDSWWWRKVDCETGEKPVEKGIGNCAAFPGSKPDKVSACYAHNGSCYVCDNSKDYIDCNADWLWNYNFPTHSWFKQVDCYDPFEEDDEEIIADGCIDESILRKQFAKEYYQDRDDMAIDYSVDFTRPTKRYDVLGRKVSQKPSQRIILFNKKTINEKQVQTNDYIAISGTITVSSDTLCDRLSSGEWVCGENRFLARRLNSVSQFKDRKKCDIKLGRDYGIVENGYLVGGMTCAWPNMEIINSNYRTIKSVDIANGIRKIVVEYRILSTTALGDNDHLTVKKGYIFPNGHVTSENEEIEFDKHENGHEFYNRCIEFDEIDVTNEFECTLQLGKKTSESQKRELIEKAIKKDLEEIVHSLLQEKININQEKIKAMSLRFHRDHGIGGYSENYVCPTN